MAKKKKRKEARKQKKSKATHRGKPKSRKSRKEKGEEQMAKEFEKELAAMESAWNDAPETSDLPEGTYTMTLQEADLRKTKSSGKMRATFRYVVSEGEHLGASQFDGFTLDPDNPMGMSMLKQFLGKKMGYEIPDSTTGLVDILADITKRSPIVSAQIVRKGEFTNVRVLEVLGEGGEAGETPAEEEVEEAPAPKAPIKKAKAVAAKEPEAVDLSVGAEVQFKNEGDVIVGKIVKKKKGGFFDVECDDAVYQDVPGEMLTAVGVEAEPAEEETEEAPAEEEIPAEDDGEEEKRLALINTAQAHGVEVTDDMTLEDLVAEMGQYEWKKSDLVDDEIAALEAAGIPVVAPAKPKPASKPAPKPALKPASKPVAKQIKRKK